MTWTNMPIKQIRLVRLITLALAITLTVVSLTNYSTRVQAQYVEQAVLTATSRNLPTLRLGIKNQQVKQLQEALNRLGFYRGSITGNFDRRTEAAVKSAQQHYGLSTDGVVNSATWQALLKNRNDLDWSEPDFSGDGRPGSREAAGRRGSSGYCPAVDMPLIALVPATEANNKSESVLGLTVAEYPTFWFYVPYSSQDVNSGDFVLLDDEDNYVYRTTFTLSEKPGVVSIPLPSTAKPLEIGKPYRWYFLISCAPQKPSRNVLVNGWVQRVALSPTLSSELQAATPRERIYLYAANSIWYDAVTALADLRRTQPEDAAIAAEWSELLQSVGLEKLAQKPVVAGLHS